MARGSRLRAIVIVCSILAALGSSAAAPEGAGAAVITLSEAVAVALNRTARAQIIDGDVDIAEQGYRAKRLNFYLPTISINGAVPSYQQDQSYRFFGGSNRKQLYKTTDLDFTSFIQLQQSLFTGGSLVMTANLASTKNRYPDTSPTAGAESFLNEHAERGFFEFQFEQPLLKPSVARNDLADRRDARDLAQLTRLEEEAALQKEVTEAYVDLLLARVTLDAEAVKLEGARLTAQIDSTKWQDAVISHEDWLASSLKRLDAELVYRDAQAQALERQRALALLLDADPTQTLELAQPEVVDHPSDQQQQRWLADWEQALSIRKAEVEAAKAERSARYTATGKGLTGDFRAGYSTGQGEVRLDGQPDQPIDTQGWSVALNVSYPLWDGGAADAAVAAAHSTAARAQLQLARARQDARRNLLKLTNAVAVGFRRLEILRSQIAVAEDALAVAQTRFDDGRISRVQLLEVQALLLASRSSFLNELKLYLSNRVALESQFGALGS